MPAPRHSSRFGFLLADIRFGIRTLAAAPGFTIAALLAIALGVGATTAVFSLANAVLIRPLPYGHARDLVYIWTPNPHLEGVPREIGPSTADYFDWRRRSHSFSSLASFDQNLFTFAGARAITRIGAALVSGNFFQTLEVSPQIGRPIVEDDDRPGSEHVVVISDSLWRSEFAGDPNIIGRKLRLNRDDYKIVGVMPPAFGYPHENDFPYSFSDLKSTQVWIPMARAPKPGADRLAESGEVIGRLRPGVSLASAQAEMTAIEATLDPLYPKNMQGWTAWLVPFVESSVGPVRTMFWLLLGAVSLVLLIACSNVANLLAARGSGRTYEMGVRSALGAAPARLVWQLLTESWILATGGALLGMLLAYGAVRFVVRLNPGDIPRLDGTSLDARVLLFTLLVTFLSGFAFGILPALVSSRVNVVDVLKRGGSRGIAGSSNRLRHGLIVAEVALAVVLLAGAGLLIRSYLKLASVDAGFSTSTLTMTLSLDDRYNTPQKQLAFFERLTGALSAVPSVQAAGAVNTLPLTGHGSLTFLEVKDYPNRKEQTVDSRTITQGYFDAMGIPLLAGRMFAAGDSPNQPPSIIVDRAFVNTYFRGKNPLGQQVRFGGPNSPWAIVIGVTGDVRHASLEEKPRPAVYQPLSWGPQANADIAIRGKVPPLLLVNSARQVLGSLDSALAFTNIRTMSERMADATARRRFQTTILAVFAAIALTLALVGLYALMSYSVKQRTPEIGVRMALGATRPRVLGLILSNGLGLVSAGIGIGLGGALIVTRVLSASLYEISALDPLTFIGVPILLLLVAMAACLVPCWKATQVDPVEALRSE